MNKEKIAVIGGGVGAISAVYAIMSRPELRERYDITVYQTGWRLGGKCASGRNQGLNNRNQSHGLHVWAGFYLNSISQMTGCYNELNANSLRSPDAALGTFDKAFKGLDHFF